MAEFRQDYTSIDWFVANSFMGRAAKDGFTGFFKTSRFGVLFELPRGNGIFFDDNLGNIENYLTNNIISISMPAVSVSSTPTPLRFKIGRRLEEDTITVRFYEDPIMSVRNSMWSWIDSMARRRSDTDNFDRRYFDEVKGKIRIYPILLNGDRSIRYDLLSDVIPANVQPLDLNIGNEQEMGQTSVTFKFRYHEVIST